MTFNTLKYNIVKISEVLRSNLAVRSGDTIRISKTKDIKPIKSVQLAVYADSVKTDDDEEDLYETFIKPYFVNAKKPVKINNW
jgi:hypothetical protein